MLNSLLVGISPTINGGGTEEQGGVILRREQVIKVLFDGKAGIIEESEETFGTSLLENFDMTPTFRGQATVTYRLAPLALSQERLRLAIASSQNG
jgi:hypothetical protein